MNSRRLSLAFAALALAGCGGSDAASGGDVWEIDHADDRDGAPAALLAYVSGLHVMMIDGDDAVAGMTRLTAESRPGGGKTLKLTPSLEAELAPTADGLELRFSSGETIPMRRKVAAGSGQ